MTTTDWTVHPETGRYNSSPKYNQTRFMIRDTLVERAQDLVTDNVRSVSHAIIARLVINLGFLVNHHVPTSSELLELSGRVTEIIRDSGSDLMTFGAHHVAGLILAQLAHYHGLHPREEQWVVEFRNGGYFQHPNSDSSGPKETAQRFPSKEAAEAVAAEFTFAGGTAVQIR